MNMPSNLLMTNTGLSSLKLLQHCLEDVCSILSLHCFVLVTMTRKQVLPKVTFMKPIPDEARNVIHIQGFKNFLHPLLATNCRQPGIEESRDFPFQNGELSIRFLDLMRNF